MPRARDLRQTSGLAGQRLWARLRGGAVDGIEVRRQHDIGRYIVDFACVALRLVIEIDGRVRDRDDVGVRDHHRQTGIEALGWTVIRFSNAVALGEPLVHRRRDPGSGRGAGSLQVVEITWINLIVIVVLIFVVHSIAIVIVGRVSLDGRAGLSALFLENGRAGRPVK